MAATPTASTLRLCTKMLRSDDLHHSSGTCRRCGRGTIQTAWAFDASFT
jgi:hypothetical protein